MESKDERLKHLQNVKNFNWGEFEKTSMFEKYKDVIEDLKQAITRSENRVHISKLNILEKEKLLIEIGIIQEN